MKCKMISVLSISLVIVMLLNSCSMSNNNNPNSNQEVEDKSSINKTTDDSVGEITFKKPEKENIIYDAKKEKYYVKNQILLTANDGVNKKEIEQLINSYNAEIVAAIEITGDYQIEFIEDMNLLSIETIISELKKHDYINSVDYHYLYEVELDEIPNDEKWVGEWNDSTVEGINWGLEAINVMEAWDYKEEMARVNIGVIDSVFDSEHKDLKFKEIWNNPEELSVEELGLKAYEHGTHVTGIIASKYNNGYGIAGVIPDVDVFAYSMAGEPTDSLVDEKNLKGVMEWKYALTLLITSECKVINVSMSNTGIKRELETYLKKMIENKYEFIIVQSAGNGKGADTTESGIFTTIEDEELKKRIIIVGAIENVIEQENNWTSYSYKLAHYTNVGSRVDVVAPGSDIYSSIPENEFKNKSGTSMAAPIVTGVAGLAFAVNPELTGEEVKEIILETTTEEFKDKENTYGLVNAAEVVKRAKNGKTETNDNVDLGSEIDKLLGVWEANSNNDKNREYGYALFEFEKKDEKNYNFKYGYVASEYMVSEFSENDIEIISEDVLKINAVTAPSYINDYEREEDIIIVDISDIDNGIIYYGWSDPSRYNFVGKDAEKAYEELYEKYFGESNKTINYNQEYEEFIKDKKYEQYTEDWYNKPMKYTILDVNEDDRPILFITSDIDMFYNTLILQYNEDNKKIVLIEDLYTYGLLSYNEEYNTLGFKLLNNGYQYDSTRYCNIDNYTLYNDYSVSWTLENYESQEYNYTFTKYKDDSIFAGVDSGEIEYEEDISSEKARNYYNDDVIEFKELKTI